MKVAVGASSFASDSDKAIKLLLDKGIEVIKNPYGRKLTEEETIKHLHGMDGLLAGLEPLSERVFQASPQLKAVARIGIGMDNVDIEAAERHGIKVSNTPDGPTDAVAEMTLAALLAIVRQIIPANADVHKGVWKKVMGRSLKGLKVFIIGYGRIGKRVGILLSNLGAEMSIYDKYNTEGSTCTLEDGLTNADVVTLHVAGNDEILTEKELSIMNDGVVILNSSRGGLINEEALYQALRSGKVSWFWGDALWEEPYRGKLCELDNVILTPHICTYTTTCRENMEMQAVQNLLEDLGYV